MRIFFTQQVQADKVRYTYYPIAYAHPKRSTDLSKVKRGYVDKPEHWRYSSARNYMGQDGLIDVFCQW
jgi:hypothetical protein